jgi:hypothetical protein
MIWPPFKGPKERESKVLVNGYLSKRNTIIGWLEIIINFFGWWALQELGRQ